MTKNKTHQSVKPDRFIASLIFLSAVAIGLLTARIVFSESFRYSFLVWNLVLAFIPVLIAWFLVNRVRRYGWRKWQQVFLAISWVAFLPNSFYLITDLIHLRPNYEADLLFDISLLMAFTLAGIIFGIISIFWVHQEVNKRISEKRAYMMVGVLFLAVSFAICLGRYTRWNTWDILLRPAGLLFDVSDRVLNPGIHLQTYQTTLVLFLVMFSTYAVTWEAIRLIRGKQV